MSYAAIYIQAATDQDQLDKKDEKWEKDENMGGGAQKYRNR